MAKTAPFESENEKSYVKRIVEGPDENFRDNFMNIEANMAKPAPVESGIEKNS